MRRLSHIALIVLLGGCHVAAPTVPEPSPLPASDAGMVIGTVSYSGIDTARDSHALLRMQRLTADGKSQAYLLDLQIDARKQHGYFAGTLPSGVYAVDEALAPGLRLVPLRASVPFEVAAGRVTDAGHLPMEAGEPRAQVTAKDL